MLSTKLNQCLPQVDLQHALSVMHEHEFDYLQIVPPDWLQNSTLMGQIDELATLYNHGRVVWAAIVQANRFLFSDDNAQSYPAEIVYDPTGQTSLDDLLSVSSKLYALKHTTPTDPELLAYANHITKETDYHAHQVPTSLFERPLLTRVMFIWRLHLPNGKLSLNYLPILISDDTENTTVLPAMFWQKSPLYRHWQKTGGSDVDICAGFFAFGKQDLWQDFTTVYPKRDEVIYFATNPDKPNYYRVLHAKSAQFVHFCKTTLLDEHTTNQPTYELVYELDKSAVIKGMLWAMVILVGCFLFGDLP